MSHGIFRCKWFRCVKSPSVSALLRSLIEIETLMSLPLLVEEENWVCFIICSFSSQLVFRYLGLCSQVSAGKQSLQALIGIMITCWSLLTQLTQCSTGVHSYRYTRYRGDTAKSMFVSNERLGTTTSGLKIFGLEEH